MSDCHRSYVGVHLRLGMRRNSAVNHSERYVNGTVAIPVNAALGDPFALGDTSVFP